MRRNLSRARPIHRRACWSSSKRAKPAAAQAADVDPEMILHVGAVPVGIAGGRRLEHGRGTLDEGLPDMLPTGLVEVAIAPVVNDRQAEKLMPRRQIHAIVTAVAPGGVVAGGQRPLLGGVEILPVAGHQIRHAPDAAWYCRPRAATVARPRSPRRLLRYFGAPCLHGPVGQRPHVRPETRVRRSDCRAKLRDALCH